MARALSAGNDRSPICVSRYRITRTIGLAISLIAAATLGGCPDGSTNGIEQLVTGDTASPVVAGIQESNDEGVATNPEVFPATVYTNINTPVQITLTGRPANPANTLFFSTIQKPLHGSVAPVGTAGPTSITFSYTPDLNFTGTEQFTFRATEGVAQSNVATVTILVYPLISFSVTPVDGARPLTVQAMTTTAGDDRLPEGQCTWAVDGSTISGPTSTHSSQSFQFTSGGQHTISLSLAFVGLSAPIAAPYLGGPNTVATVTVRPIIAGRVIDASERPLAGVQVSGGGGVISTTTDSNGRYELTVPYGWSGTLTPSSAGQSFNPASAAFTNVTADDTSRNFMLAPANRAPTATSQNVTMVEDTPTTIALAGSDPDGNALRYTVTSLPAHGVLRDLGPNQVISSGALPYALAGSGFNVQFTPDADYSGMDSFTFVANDGQVSSTPATVGLSVTPINDPPVGNSRTVLVTGGGTTLITLTGSDVENASLTFSLVSIPAHGSLVGQAPNYTYTPAAGYFGPDSFNFRCFDGSQWSSMATISITVGPANAVPTANAQNIVMNAGSSRAITLTASDANGDPLLYNIVTQPTRGSLTGNPPNVTYTPNTGVTGADSFSFRAYDGMAFSNIATVSLTIQAVNNAPVANAQSVTATAGVARTITLTASDADNDALSMNFTAFPAHGTLTGTPPIVTYTATAGYTGPDSFAFRAYDGTAYSTPATVSITVVRPNTPPTATAQNLTMNTGTSRAITLSGADADNDTLTFSIVTFPTRGSLIGSPPNMSYTPNPGVTGADSFTFRAYDGSAYSSPATISITIQATNNAPTANAQSVNVTAGSSQSVTLTGSDPDGNPLSYSIVNQPTRGTLTGSPPNVTYTPSAGTTSGSDSFTFRVHDGTVFSSAATVSITIQPANNAPTANAQSVTVTAGSSRAITLTGSDPDGNPLTYSIVNQPTRGTLTGSPPSVTYTPGAGTTSGSDSFTFRVHDGTVFSTAATVSITIQPANAAPTANAQSVTVASGSSQAITLTGSDPDGNPLTYSIATQPVWGALTGTPPNMTYTPNTGVTGSDSFTFRVFDGLAFSNAATVSITIQLANRAPTANAQSVTVTSGSSQAITLTGSDPDGNPLTYSIVSQPTRGTLTGAPPSVTYTPNTGVTGSDSFTFRVSDGSLFSSAATVSITVQQANRAPTANAQSVTLTAGASRAITLTGSDPDGNPLTYSIVSQPTRGTLTGAPPSVTYTPNTGVTGSDSFTFRVSDGSLFSSAATVSLTINAPVNTAPVAADQQVTMPAGGTRAITLSATDADGDTLTYSIVTQPAQGTLTGTPPAVTYAPATGYSGPDSFTFRANDGTVNSANATVSITVTPPTGSWSPPIGIPAPAFGIAETNAMYATQQYNFGSGLVAYPDAGNGPYTHYVDTSSAASTDSSNTYGTPARPRKTIPQNLPAGSVVEVHGGPYTYTVGGVIPLGGAGTAAKPVIIRGYSATQRPVLSKSVEITGTYVIVENFDLNAWSTSNDAGMTFRGGVHHVCVRGCEVRNGPNATTSAIAIGGSSGSTNSQIVIYNNSIHDNGDWQATFDQDHHGIGVFDYSDNIWVLDNTMYHNSGDGIQINSGTAGAMATTHHIYVGRNDSYQNKQAGFWTKAATDVIFSQNIAHNHRPSDSSSGQGMGWQYGPERVWFLYNEIYDCEYGINSGSYSGPGGNGTGQNIYIIGNIIHDIRNTGSTSGGAWSDGAAISIRDEQSIKHILNNTIYNVDYGITNPRQAPVRIINNILSNVTNDHVFVESSTTASNSTLKNTLFPQPAKIKWGSSTVYNVNTFRSAFSGQGGGCIEGAPQFVAPASNNFRLQAASPARNAGITDAAYATFTTQYSLDIRRDPAGTTRPAGSAFDMGAYEYAE